MTPEDILALKRDNPETYQPGITDAIMRCEVAMNTGAEIKFIVAGGVGRSNRDIDLHDLRLSADECKPIFDAVIAVLRAKAQP